MEKIRFLGITIFLNMHETFIRETFHLGTNPNFKYRFVPRFKVCDNIDSLLCMHSNFKLHFGICIVCARFLLFPSEIAPASSEVDTRYKRRCNSFVLHSGAYLFCQRFPNVFEIRLDFFHAYILLVSTTARPICRTRYTSEIIHQYDTYRFRAGYVSASCLLW